MRVTNLDDLQNIVNSQNNEIFDAIVLLKAAQARIDSSEHEDNDVDRLLYLVLEKLDGATSALCAAI